MVEVIHPLGKGDVDPTQVIAFKGVVAVPRWKREDDEKRWQRGQITIDFFDLNREGLLEDRARVIADLWIVLQIAKNNNPFAIRRKATLVSTGASHANCARCFMKPCRKRPKEAEALANQALRILEIDAD